MKLERLLQFHTAALALIGALFLGLGQEHLAMPIVLAIAAVIALSVSSVWSWFKLGRVPANMVAVVAVVWSLHDFFQRGTEGQLLAIADMLVYLQIVLLFQERATRVFWQLLVLSLLQVVVAAALNLGPQFSLLLALYLAVAMSTLVLLSIYRECQPPEAAKSRRAAGRWEKLLASPRVASPSLAEQQTLLLRSPWLVLGKVVVLTGATLTFATIFFFAAPRQVENVWDGPRNRSRSTTGFRTQVSLETSGKVKQSNELVMRVSLTRLIDHRPYIMLGDPYFHGLVLTTYVHPDKGRCRWIARQVNRSPGRRRPSWLKPRPIAKTLLIRQEYVMESAHSPTLFAILPFYQLTNTPDNLRMQAPTPRLVRVPSDDTPSSREYRFAAGTMGLRDGRQLRVVPHPNPVRDLDDLQWLEQELNALREIDRSRFPRLCALAAKTLQSDEVETGSALDKCLSLQNHFLLAGNYTYSLDQDFPHDTSLDPIEDFVANHRTGHCEYFASALILMLRSQGIPARMVTGYKGGEFNSIGQYFQVRQKHSHAWVEAYLPPEEVPESELGSTPSPGGGWYRLDPTPAQFAELAGNRQFPLLDRLGQTMDYLDLMWRDYVLGLNSSRQQDKLYDPLTSTASNSFPEWSDPRRIQSSLRSLATGSGGGKNAAAADTAAAPWSRALWLGGGLTSSGLAIWGFVFLWKRWRRARRAAPGDPRLTYNSPPKFYRRLKRVLARFSLRKASGQTAQEFIAAAERLPKVQASPEAKRLLDEVVSAYHRVRFGRQTLSEQEAANVERALAQLVVISRQT
jgi:hypothetical protein